VSFLANRKRKRGRRLGFWTTGDLFLGHSRKGKVVKEFMQVCDLWAIAPLPYRWQHLKTQKHFHECQYL